MHEDNEVILDIFSLVSGQYISDMNTTINLLVLFEVLDRYGIPVEEQEDIIKDVQRFNSVYIKTYMDKNGKDKNRN